MSWLMRRQLPVYREIGMGNGMAYPEVRVALTGGHDTAMLLVTDKGEQIVSVATPIHYRGVVQGALLLSTPPGVIDDILQEERNIVLSLALTALAATLIASVLLYRTIAGPMRRLSEAADSVSRSIGAGAKLPELAGRTDEVGQMASAFRAMTASLYQRIEASERFAREVAHELKNPLTAARSTAESLAYAKTPEMREELVRQIQGELSRLNKLITDVSNVSRLDAELAYGETELVDIREVLHGVMDDLPGSLQHGYAQAGSRRRRMCRSYPDAFVVRAHEARLGRVITNLLDNALSFSPEGGTITVSARRSGPEIVIVVDDEGPGIPPDKLEVHLRALLLRSPAVRQHARQELGSRPEHLARHRGCLRRDASRRSTAWHPRVRQRRPLSRSSRTQGPPGARSCRNPVHGAPAGSRCRDHQGSAAACPADLSSSTAPA